VQTAEIAAEALKYSGKIVRVESLTPDSSPRDVWNEIRSRDGEAAILLAGHDLCFRRPRPLPAGRDAIDGRLSQGRTGAHRRGRNRAHAVRCSAMDADAEAGVNGSLRNPRANV